MKKYLSLGGLLLFAIVAAHPTVSAATPATNLSHPRLYFTSKDLPQLRQQRARAEFTP